VVQGFFETSEDRFLVSCFDINHPVRCESGLRQRWREQIPVCHAPQHATTRPRCNPCGEERGPQRRLFVMIAAYTLVSVRAIEPTGKIIMAECFQCLDCQVEYYDDKRCPPLVQAARRREEARSTVPVGAMARRGRAAWVATSPFLVLPNQISLRFRAEVGICALFLPKIGVSRLCGLQLRNQKRAS
jgi:hypothetical protein